VTVRLDLTVNRQRFLRASCVAAGSGWLHCQADAAVPQLLYYLEPTPNRILGQQQRISFPIRLRLIQNALV
jgi:hypothetical protein